MKLILKNTDILFRSVSPIYGISLNGGYAYSSSIRLSGNDAILIDFIAPEEDNIIQFIFNGHATGDGTRLSYSKFDDSSFGNIALYIKNNNTGTTFTNISPGNRYRVVISYAGYCMIKDMSSGVITDHVITDKVGSNDDTSFLLGVQRTATLLKLFTGKLIGVSIKKNVTSIDHDFINSLNGALYNFDSIGIEPAELKWYDNTKTQHLSFTKTPIITEFVE